jgi:glycosyltransferase involved in cell wall biosynthesis
LLIDVDAADQLAAAILKLANDRPLRDRLGENGRQMSIGSTPSQMAASYLDLYRYVLESD